MDIRGRSLPFLLGSLVACALLGACSASHKVVSARHTPCKYSEIEISQETYAAEEETWIATCGDRAYSCATQAIGNRVQYRCRPLARAP